MSRRSALAGINQPTSVLPATAATVAPDMATPASPSPSGDTSSENRCASSPICANKPAAIPAASVMNFTLRQSAAPRGAVVDDGGGGRS
jgi:hypothetical protein